MSNDKKRTWTSLIRSKGTAKKSQLIDEDLPFAGNNLPDDIVNLKENLRDTVDDLSKELENLYMALKNLKNESDLRQENSKQYEKPIKKCIAYIEKLKGFNVDDSTKLQAELEKLTLFEMMQYFGAFLIELPTASALTVVLAVAEVFAGLADLCTILMPKDKTYCQEVYETIMKEPMRKIDDYLRTVDNVGPLLKKEEKSIQALASKVEKLKNSCQKKGIDLPDGPNGPNGPLII